MELLIALALLEVFADPPGSDNNQEFVEFSFNYTFQDSNLTNSTGNTSFTNYSLVDFLQNESFVFADAASNDTLEYVTTTRGVNSSEHYLLVVEEEFNHSQIQTNNTCHIFSAGSTIGNNLNNDEDDILFYRNTTLLVNESYTVLGCAAGENCSLHKQNDTFVAQEPSPCLQTVFAAEETEPTCELNLSLDAETIYELGDAIRFTPRIIGENYTLTYWWEDLYGNVLKKPTSTTNDNPKQYTPKQPDNERDFAVLLYARLENHCNETQESHLAVVRGEEKEEQESTSSSSSSSSSAGFVTNKKPLFTFSAPKTSYGNLSLTTTIYYPEQKGMFQVATYAYRGSTNYSTREPKNITVDEMNASATQLQLAPGNYSLKTQVWFPGRKTPEEERREITILEMPVIEIKENVSVAQEKQQTPPIQGSAIESETKEGFNTPWLGLLFGLLLAVFALIRHRSDDSEKKNHSLPEQDPQDQNQESASEKNTTLHTWIAKEENQKGAAHQTS